MVLFPPGKGHMPRYCFPRARAICHGIVSPGRGPYATVLFPPGEGHMPRYCFPRARAIWTKSATIHFRKLDNNS
ncbi:hypothetical protein LOK49_LG04G02129 [Camellia lanceoleosa]|uniref:Uncharacterized protein n=1 Tax=Camellia lanceoleosa TaxID=1840588 RepID=A0ACC0I1Z8_9ERIC|nr:hypothetical protein LOK49_LG04G02129 [Camellia lanceoleosa]